MANPQRNELQVSNDRHLLAKIALENPGATSQQVSDIFLDKYNRRIPARTVRHDLQMAREHWMKEASGDIALAKQVELKRIDMLEQAAWDAWRDSRKPKLRETVERLAKMLDAEDVAQQIVDEMKDDADDKIVADLFQRVIKEAVDESVANQEHVETFINKITTLTETSVGDVKFLRIIHDVQQERRKIWGVYAPDYHQIDVRKIQMEIQGYTTGWSPDRWTQVEAPVADDILEGEIE